MEVIGGLTKGMIFSIAHGNRGRQPADFIKEELRLYVALTKGKYDGFNQQHFNEKLD